MANDSNVKNETQNQSKAPNAEVQKPQVKVEAASAKETFYTVTEDREIPRGGGSVLLRKGKRISSHGYDIAKLRAHGVKLSEVSVSQ
jgi:hypothetical protein